MAADARIVRQRLRRLLQNADMESSTQRTLTQQLEAELGLGPGALAAHKPLIKVSYAPRGLRLPHLGAPLAWLLRCRGVAESARLGAHCYGTTSGGHPH